MSIELFVGFGGSGGKTLAAFARMVADDSALADRGDRKFYFLLVDTDSNELKRSKATIEKEFRRTANSSPVIETLDLAHGVDRLQDLVKEVFVDLYEREGRGEDVPELKVARKHWYFMNGGGPFTASRLPAPLRDGAGQCPLAAHFAAWSKLEAFEEKLKSLKTEMIKRNNEGDSVNLVMVGSLAGGTGRGCWQLLSLKARTIFKRCTPYGFFFDASVFDKIAKQNKDQMPLRIHVNSLTGISEIVGWIRNDRMPDRSPFQLPLIKAFASGDFALNTRDILDERVLIEERGVTPIDNVFLITNESDSVSFQSPEHAYRMVGAALFANKGIEPVNSKAANEAQVGSCCAGVARVPATELRVCLNHGVSERMLRHLTAENSQLSVRLARELAESFWFEANEVESARDFGDGSVLGSIRSKFREYVETTQIENKLKSNSIPDVQRQVAAGTFAVADNQAVSQAVSAALTERLGSTAGKPESHFRAKLEDALKNASNEKSIGCPKHLLDCIIEHLNTKLKSIPSLDLMNVISEEQLRARLSKEIESKSKRSFPVFGERWDENERAHIASLIRSLALDANYKAILVELGERINGFLAICKEYQGVIYPIHSALLSAKESQAEAFLAQSRVLFWPESDAEFLQSLPVWHAQEFVLERTLKPVGAQKMLDAVEKSALSLTALNNATALFVDEARKSWMDSTQRSKCANASAREELKDEMGKQVVERLLTKTAVPADDVSKHCGMGAVIELMEARVRLFLDNNFGSERDVEKVQDWMETFFGRRFETASAAGGQTVNKFKKIPQRELLMELAYSLSQRTDPMMKASWRNNSERTNMDVVTVYMPSGVIPAADAGQFCEEAMKLPKSAEDTSKFRKHVSHPVESYNVVLLPDKHFMIVAYSKLHIPNFFEDAFDSVTSFTKWKTDTKLREWLRLCESSDPNAPDSSIFSGKDENFGLGYVHPCFVTDEKWRKRRWAPWGEGEAVQNARASEIDSVLYALCGNLPNAKEEYVDQARDVVQAMGQVKPNAARSHLWTMPILQRGSGDDQNKWVLSRKSFRRESGAIIEATGGTWKVGHTFTTLRDFMKWMGWGSERGMTAEGKDFVASIVRERELIGSVAIVGVNESFGENKRDSVKQSLFAFLEEYRTGYLDARAEEQKMTETPFVEALTARIRSGAFRWDTSGGNAG